MAATTSFRASSSPAGGEGFSESWAAQERRAGRMIIRSCGSKPRTGFSPTGRQPQESAKHFDWEK
jgi:hypothetical protein